jgi:hypothetical protein
VTPTHAEGRAAALRVQAANADGALADARDGIILGIYNISMEVRRLPEHGRMAVAQQAAKQIMANTRESLD